MDKCCLKFYVLTEKRRNKSATEIFKALHEIWGDSMPSKATIYRWYDEPEKNKNETRGRPSIVMTDSNIEIVKCLIEENQKMSVRQLSSETGINKDSIHIMLKEKLDMRKICSVWVPHKLTDNHKNLRLNAAKGIRSKLIDLAESVYLNYVIEDETWVTFKPITSMSESKVWLKKGEKVPRIVKPEMTAKKTMLMVAFTANKKFSIEGTEKGETINAERYIKFIKNTGDKWRTLRSDRKKLSDLIWQHDNARSHSAADTREFCNRRGMELLWQPPYSPDLNICDRWLFKTLKKELKNEHFQVLMK